MAVYHKFIYPPAWLVPAMMHPPLEGPFNSGPLKRLVLPEDELRKELFDPMLRSKVAELGLIEYTWGRERENHVLQFARRWQFLQEAEGLSKKEALEKASKEVLFKKRLFEVEFQTAVDGARKAGLPAYDPLPDLHFLVGTGLTTSELEEVAGDFNVNELTSTEEEIAEWHFPMSLREEQNFLREKKRKASEDAGFTEEDSFDETGFGDGYDGDYDEYNDDEDDEEVEGDENFEGDEEEADAGDNDEEEDDDEGEELQEASNNPGTGENPL